jgi:hypothetical protein
MFSKVPSAVLHLIHWHPAVAPEGLTLAVRACPSIAIPATETPVNEILVSVSLLRLLLFELLESVES